MFRVRGGGFLSEECASRAGHSDPVKLAKALAEILNRDSLAGSAERAGGASENSDGREATNTGDQ